MADKRHHLHCSLLLTLVDQVSVFPLRLLQTVAGDRDVVDGERDRLSYSGGQRTVFEAGESVPPHVEVDVLSLKVTQTVQLLSNHLFYLLSQAFR